MDSAVAAWLLLERGFDVFGLHMQLGGDWNTGESGGAEAGAVSAVESAREACRMLGIDFHAVDLGETFLGRVARPFAETYLGGRTPNPCVICNREIKFGSLLDEAQRLGADALATGHYIIKKRDADEWRLFMGADRTRDQSYFLYHLGQRTLDRVLFPNGAYKKMELAAKASELGLPAADRPESREICFIGPGGYGELVEKLFPGHIAPGPIVDAAGTEIGRHSGIVHYTLGQRRGLGIAAPEPLYVVALDAENNRIVAGAAGELYSGGLLFEDASFVSGGPPESGGRLHVKIRYNAAPAPAVYRGTNAEGRHSVEFEQPLRAVTPGQAAVFYDGDRLLGGGTISQALK